MKYPDFHQNVERESTIEYDVTGIMAVNWVIAGIQQKTSNPEWARDAYWSAPLRFTIGN